MNEEEGDQRKSTDATTLTITTTKTVASSRRTLTPSQNPANLNILSKSRKSISTFQRTATPTTTTTSNSTTNQLRLLENKCVYLDIVSTYKHLNELKECLITIGVTLADCMSKDVNYVITNRVKYEELTSTISSAFFSPSPLNESANGTKSNTPHHHHHPQKTSPTLSHFSSRLGAINRTQAILKEASKTVCTDILTNARRLGIKILHLNDIEKYVDKYMLKMKLINAKTSATVTGKADSQQQQQQQPNNSLLNSIDMTGCDVSVSEGANHYRVRKLVRPYLKFESICKQYKPIFSEFTEWHHLVYDNPKQTNASPFQIYFSDEVKGSNESTSNNNTTKTATAPTTTSRIQLQQTTTATTTNKTTINIQQIKNTLIQRTASTLTATNSLKLIQTQPPNAAQKRKQNGYCECCKQRYDNLKQHITSVQHENYEKNYNNFKDIDYYIDTNLNYEKFLLKFGVIEKTEVFRDVENDNDKENQIAQEQVAVVQQQQQQYQRQETFKREEVCIMEIVDEDEDGNDDRGREEGEADERDIQTSKQNRTTKLIDRLIFESKSLGEIKSNASRRGSICKYTEMSNKDFNTAVLVSTTNQQSSIDENSKSIKKRKRNQQTTLQRTTSDITTDRKPLKLKLERNKVNNTWQISSSSLDPFPPSQTDVDRHFDNGLFQLAGINEMDEASVVQQAQQQQQQYLSQSTPTVEQISKKPKITTPAIEPKPMGVAEEPMITEESSKPKLTLNIELCKKLSVEQAAVAVATSVVTPKKPKKSTKKTTATATVMTPTEKKKTKQPKATQPVYDFTKSTLFQNQAVSAKNLTLNYINRLPSPSDPQQIIIPPTMPQATRNPFTSTAASIIQERQQQSDNYCIYLASPPPQIPYYYTPTPYMSDAQYLQPPMQILQQPQHQSSHMPPPLPLQTQQSNNSSKRISLNSSTGNLFDSLSAANSLINNF